MELYLGTTYYGFGFILNGFMVLNIDNCVLSNTNDNYYSLTTTSRNTCDNVIIWHARLGHIGQERMNRLATENLPGQFTKSDVLTCEYRLAGKTTRKPFGKETRVEIPLQFIYYNIYGPMIVRVRHDALYFITFINEFTHYDHVYLISHKSKVLDCFIRYINLVENQLDKKIKTLRIDRGKEYLPKQFKIFVMKRVLVDNWLF